MAVLRSDLRRRFNYDQLHYNSEILREEEDVRAELHCWTTNQSELDPLTVDAVAVNNDAKL